MPIDDRVTAHAALAWLSALALDLQAVMHHAGRGIELGRGLRTPALSTALVMRAFGHSAYASITGCDPEHGVDARRAASCAAAGFGGRTLAAALASLSVAQHLLGRHGEALEAALEFHASFVATPALHGPVVGMWSVEIVPALIAGGRGDLADAVLARWAADARRSGVDLVDNHLLCITAVAEQLRGCLLEAAVLLGAARRAGGADRHVISFRTPSSVALYRRTVDQVREALGPEAARRARDEGRALSTDAAFERVRAAIGRSGRAAA